MLEWFEIGDAFDVQQCRRTLARLQRPHGNDAERTIGLENEREDVFDGGHSRVPQCSEDFELTELFLPGPVPENGATIDNQQRLILHIAAEPAQANCESSEESLQDQQERRRRPRRLRA